MKEISLKQLNCFLEVCRDFHFSRAAKRLGISQPPLSRHIKELERELGAPLFIRSGKTVTLSPTGEAFLAESYRVPSTIRRAADAARRAAFGECEQLRIGFVGALLGEELLGLLEELRNSYSNTRLSLFDLSPAEILNQLEASELDGGFLGFQPASLSPHLTCKTWKKERLLVCLSRSHRLSTRRAISIRDIQSENLVALNRKVAPAYRSWIDSIFDEKGRSPHIVQETNSAQAMLAMTVAGCGISLLPNTALGAARKHLAVIPFTHKQAKTQEVFIWSKESSSPALAHLVSGLRL